VLLPEPVDLDLDSQCCAECIAIADICEYHRGWADGWDDAAAVMATFSASPRGVRRD
jgi:hypothetical protein